MEKNEDVKQRKNSKSKSTTQTAGRRSKSAEGARQSTSSISKYIKAKKNAEGAVNGAAYSGGQAHSSRSSKCTGSRYDGKGMEDQFFGYNSLSEVSTFP
jgi:hypothetical protein